MIKRRTTRLVRKRLKEYPAVVLVGARQSGKTTLARALGGAYFDLEQQPDRLRLDLRWDALCRRRRLVILDEVQTWPELFPRLRGAIDQDRRRHGRFLLLGSVSPGMMTQVSESLAGRLSLVELPPFLVGEVPHVDLDALWLRGGFPDGGILKPQRFPQWQRDYLDLLTQRDLPNWGLPASPQVTQRLVRMVAAVHGQIWNASQIAASLGLSYPTVNSYMDYLEGAFLVRRVMPYQANVRKRLTKRPRFYWRDSGLLHAILQAPDMDELLARPWVGASWEGFVLDQVLGSLQQWGRHADAYFLRTSDGYEIDLILDFGNRLWAVEVKLSSRPSPEDLRRLNKAADLIDADRRFLVTRTVDVESQGKQASCNLPWFLSALKRA